MPEYIEREAVRKILKSILLGHGRAFLVIRLKLAKPQKI